MATSINQNAPVKPTPLSIPYTPPSQILSGDQPPTSPTNPQAIHAPLPTRRMLSQLLRQWQQSLAPSAQQSPITSIKEEPSTTPMPATLDKPVALEKPADNPTITPQISRTPSRLTVSSPQYTATTPTASTSPALTLTTPTASAHHSRRASITAFLPPESLLMSPIPRARNPGGFRPGRSPSIGSATTGLGFEIDEDSSLSPFGEVVGLVGGWEDKMRSATAWAVVNTTAPPFNVNNNNTVSANTMDENLEEGIPEDGRRSTKGVDVNA